MRDITNQIPTTPQQSPATAPNYKQINRYDKGRSPSELTHILSSVSQWSASKLWLNGNSNYLMIKQIQSISFPSLSVLLLSSNQIESIENLSEISLPNLQLLNLSNNSIIEIRTIRKSKWPKIKNLILHNNSINSLSALSELKCDNLMELSLQTVKSTHSAPISCVSKMQSLESLCIRSKSRIPENSLLGLLSDKKRLTIDRYE